MLIAQQLVCTLLGRMILQTLYRLTVFQVLIDDDRHIIHRQMRIPHVIGIDHRVWPMAALIEAATVVNANTAFQPGLGNRFFEGAMNGL